MAKLRITGAWVGVLEVELDKWTVPMFKDELAKRSNSAPNFIKLICAGQELQESPDNPNLAEIGVKNNAISDYLEAELNQRCNLLRFWDFSDKKQFLVENANSIRAVVGNAFAGADSDLIDALPGLEIVSSHSVGLDKIDLVKCKERGVRVTNTPDVLTDDVADLAIGLMISVLRRIPQCDRYVRSGKWKRGDFMLTTKTEVDKGSILLEAEKQRSGRIARNKKTVAGLAKLDIQSGPVADFLSEIDQSFLLYSEPREETLFLTVNLIDRFLAKQSMGRKKLQMVGLTAMLLACKYEEVSVPVIEDLIFISDKAYKRNELLEMLELLSFFLIELSLVEYDMLKFPPSLLAAATVYTAQSTLYGFKQWTKTCEWYSTDSEDQLMECSKKRQRQEN